MDGEPKQLEEDPSSATTTDTSSNSVVGVPNDLSFTHTPFYCEENVYLLCKKLCMMGIANHKGTDLFVVFMSNEPRKIPLWCQKASKRTDGLVIWDYHVICIQSQTNNEGDIHHVVWDLDSSLLCPVPLKQYIAKAIRHFLPPISLNPAYTRLFRVVHAPLFLQCFASDRSHMKDPLGNWMAPPPVYESILAEDGTVNNLDEYISMHVVDTEAMISSGLYTNKYGMVISENMLESFFSQVYQ